MNMRMRVCCLDYYEAGPFCYLVIQMENLLRQLQLFYFHLWPIYWLSLVNNKKFKIEVKSSFNVKAAGTYSNHSFRGRSGSSISPTAVNLKWSDH
jgi:hypothetical protein